jgi:hypothetical protein
MAEYTEEELRAMIAEAEAELKEGGGEQQAFTKSPPGMDEATSNRVFRSNMFRRLDKVFGDYEMFTPEEAAIRTKYKKVNQFVNYLKQEAQRPHSRIKQGPEGKYFINDPFV